MSAPPLLRRAWIPGLWLLLWQGAALLVGEELLLPAPLPVLGRMAALLGEGRFWLACGHSLGRILLGFLLGWRWAACWRSFPPASPRRGPSWPRPWRR